MVDRYLRQQRESYHKYRTKITCIIGGKTEADFALFRDGGTIQKGPSIFHVLCIQSPGQTCEVLAQKIFLAPPTRLVSRLARVFSRPTDSTLFFFGAGIIVDEGWGLYIVDVASESGSRS